MDDNIISIVHSQFDLEEDIAEFAQEIKLAKPFSLEKQQLQYLLAEICKSDKADPNARRQAARALIESSDLYDAIRSIPDHQELLADYLRAAQHGGLRG